MIKLNVGDPRPEGEWKTYRKTQTAEMMLLTEPVSAVNRENVEARGQPGDYLVEDGYGGYYVCGKEFHDENYEEVKSDE